MILLVDERPEEVTEFRRALPGAEIYASSNDEASRNHTRIAELAIERAKRLVDRRLRNAVVGHGEEADLAGRGNHGRADLVVGQGQVAHRHVTVHGR